ncbi:hypothetical protein TWF694_001428 [Orbilia ellipsospora]|uniref:Uncharacterized protein n=1 Tax=Orbilia ellipsospora TaxID=2528407 RepID=A0AAV9XY46_9PEZI
MSDRSNTNRVITEKNPNASTITSPVQLNYVLDTYTSSPALQDPWHPLQDHTFRNHSAVLHNMDRLTQDIKPKI